MRPAAAGRRRSGPSRSPTTTRSSTARSPTAPGSAGSARTPTSCCPAPAAGSCSAASSPRRRCRPPPAPVADGCGTCRRCIDGCPTGAIVAPGVVDANRCLAWVLQKPGHDPGRAPRGGRRPHLRLRRLPGGVPADRPPRAAATADRCDADAQAWVDVLDLLDADDDDAARPLRAGGTSPVAIRGGCGATRWSCSATPATPRRPRGRRRARPLPRRRRRDARRARRLGAATARPRRHRCADSIADGRAPTSRRRREAPARHERLPAEDRRHPVAAVGVVAAAAARLVRRAHQPVPRCGRSSTPPSRSGSSARREPVLLPHPWMVRRIDAHGRARSAPTWSCSTRRCRSGWSGRRCELPYDVVLHGAEVTVPGRLPGTKQALGARAARRPPRRRRRRRTRRAEAERAAGRSLPITVVPPGVDVERFRPLDRRRAAAARARTFGLPADAELVVVDLAARAAQGLRHRDPGRRARWRRAGPTCVLAIAGGGRDERRLRRLAAELERAGAVPRARRQRRPAARCTAAPTCSRCCAATGGAGSSRRASASCSSRPRRAACRRSPATRGGAAEAVADGVTGRRRAPARRRRRGRRRAFEAPARRPGAPGRDGRGVARAGGRRVLLRRARRAPRAVARALP